ncbi:SDR family NAD(P)-dependent oxidoreductase [Hufsiella ginkgonis]|uniref:SDR family NAD(P)-dependent oxidoreductase n=1 Tax=Hufsiella ginkgonis TaxID=2695274 RepID=A0A7K1Y000_9SPHI|nr:SDR family NAD(P)-dependent oxidoreductase [Hufsiella ginkgonis]MXV16378.1 SDR family NAD(P)-dependent oxidoreductase [Hufsiella ginkgonis]
MKTILITGADGNLGTTVTQTFLEVGYQVLATVVNEAAKNNLAPHPSLEVQAVNLTDETETGRFIASALAKYQHIDAALLLVGGFAMGDIAATTGAELKKMYSLNFETAYYTARPLFAHMKDSGSGRLVFVGARPALQPADGKAMIAYALSKSLLFNLAACLNEEAKGIDVVATVVVPSTLDTPVNRKAMPDVDPAKWVKPQQLADIMKFICSDTAAALREPVIKVYNNA